MKTTSCLWRKSRRLITSPGNNVTDQRRPVMHEWPVSLTDDRSKQWLHMLGSAAFPAPGLSSVPQAEYADRHLENCLEIGRSGRRNSDRFNSHCREQSGVGFSSMGPLSRRPWSAFQATKVLKEHSLTIPKDHQEGRHRRRILHHW